METLGGWDSGLRAVCWTVPTRRWQRTQVQQFSNNNNSAVDLEERFLLTYAVTAKFCENALQVFCVNADENVTSLTDMMNENQNNCYNILNVLMAYVWAFSTTDSCTMQPAACRLSNFDAVGPYAVAHLHWTSSCILAEPWIRKCPIQL